MKIDEHLCQECWDKLKNGQLEKVPHKGKTLSEKKDELEIEFQKSFEALTEDEKMEYWKLMSNTFQTKHPFQFVNLVDKQIEEMENSRGRLNAEEQHVLRLCLEKGCVNSILKLREETSLIKEEDFDMSVWVRGYWKNFHSVSEAWRYIIAHRKNLKSISMDTGDTDDEKGTRRNFLESQVVNNHNDLSDPFGHKREAVIKLLCDTSESSFPFWRHLLDNTDLEYIADDLSNINLDRQLCNKYFKAMFVDFYQRIDSRLCSHCKRTIIRILANQHLLVSPAEELLTYFGYASVFQKRKVLINA